MDETTEQCKYLLPSNHWLESWGDAEPRSGYISVIQPLINPLFKTRPFQTSLLKWSTSATATVAAKDSTGKAVAVVAPGVPHDVYETYHKNYWLSKLGSTDSWDKALQDGVVEPSTPAVSAQIPDLQRIVSFRNRIIHGYDNVDDATVWGISDAHLPGLIATARSLLEKP